MTSAFGYTPPPFEPELREIQLQVIRDRYLRDAPSPGAWLWQVANNLALAEALYAGGLEGLEERLRDVEGVRVERTRSAAGESVMVLALGEPGRCDADPAEARTRFERFLQRLEALARTEPGRGAFVHWRQRFFQRMARFELLPNSPTLMNAGRALQQLSACFVLPVPDHLEGIMYALRAQALIHKSGGGTGFSFGRLRPQGDPVASTHGVASGALAFMRVFDCMTDVIKQGGTRRGANMGILPAEHPEIERFVDAKREAGALTNFNLSVAASDRFMEAVRSGAPWTLVHPRTGKPVRTLDAALLFDRIAEAAWATGDPGLVFLDRLNEAGSNPTPQLGRVESTNPCGEVGMLPYEPCNLASLNLAAFCVGEIGRARLDSKRLREAVHDAIRLLDDVIEVNRFPLPEIERMAKRIRRVGLGVMGWAEALILQGIPYDAPEALERAESVMALIEQEALRASEGLARERGVFPAWQGSVYDPASPHFAGREAFVRNAARTSIAPTGTIALAAGLHGAGIEPLFGRVYERYTARALDALQAGRQPDTDSVYREVHPLLVRVLERHACAKLDRETLTKRIAEAPDIETLARTFEIPKELSRLFVTAHEIPWSIHLQMQAAFQRHTDNAVSKTINLPRDASVADVREALLQAHALGLKGVTVYRDQSKPLQVLTHERCGPNAKTCVI